MSDPEDMNDPLRHLRKLGDAFQGKEGFLDQLERYQAAGWPFGRGTNAFLLWAKFGQKTTVN